jgi:hypothetical protein
VRKKYAAIMAKENNRPGSTLIHNDFFETKALVYKQCGFACTDPTAAAESAEYGACSFTLDGLLVQFRVAKTTPVKVGQFVTVWKRNGNGPIEPFDIMDNINLFIISTRSGSNFGQFVFPKTVLLSKGILSGNGKEGKRAIRVYPPWDIATSSQAKKTQQWQSPFFLQMSGAQKINLDHVKQLYKN